MAGYLGSVPVPQATQHRESFTCTEGQTSFATAGYTPQFLDLYLNGSHLSPADFTATNGSDVILSVAASADDVCDIISYTPFEVNSQTFTGTTTMDVAAITGVLTTTAATVFNGGFAANAGSTITTSSTDAPLSLVYTGAAANVGPVLDLYRNSASPADNDLLGEISFRGRNDNSQDVDFATIFSTVIDASDGTEDGEISFKTMKAGTLTETLVMQSGFVGINTLTPGAPLHIEAADNANLLRFTVTSQEDWAFKGASAVGSNDTISFGIINSTQAMTWDEAGRCTMPNQPAFMVHPASTQTDIAINGIRSVVFGTEIFDIGGNFADNVFTAPVVGKYQLNVEVRLDNVDTAATYYHLYLITSNKTYHSIIQPKFTSDPAYMSISTSVLADMDAGDGAYVGIYHANGTQQTDISVDSNFSGFLAC